MKKLYFLSFILLSSLSFGQNLLSNPGFENWTATTPDNWFGSYTNIAASGVTQSSDAYEGTSSVLLTRTGTSHGRFTNQPITVSNVSYTLTYFAKGDGDLRNAFHDGAYSTYGAYTTLATANGWVPFTYEFTPDAGDLQVIFSLRNTTGDGILIDNVSLVETSTLSNNEVNLTSFNVYPNPTSTGFVNITSTNADAISVAVFDVLGKQVINKTISNNRLDVSSLNSGLYIVKISQNNATVTKKLVIK